MDAIINSTEAVKITSRINDIYKVSAIVKTSKKSKKRRWAAERMYTIRLVRFKTS